MLEFNVVPAKDQQPYNSNSRFTLCGFVHCCSASVLHGIEIFPHNAHPTTNDKEPNEIKPLKTFDDWVQIIKTEYKLLGFARHNRKLFLTKDAVLLWLLESVWEKAYSGRNKYWERGAWMGGGDWRTKVWSLTDKDENLGGFGCREFMLWVEKNQDELGQIKIMRIPKGAHGTPVITGWWAPNLDSIQRIITDNLKTLNKYIKEYNNGKKGSRFRVSPSVRVWHAQNRRA